MIVTGVGASAGGLEALQDLLDNLPDNSDSCYIIAQHMSPSHKSMMVELLRKHTSLTVREAEHGETLLGSMVYVTPPNKNIAVKDGRLALTDPASHTILPKPSIDYLFTSLAEQYGNQAVGIILSGTGSDGSMGMKAIKAEGGITIVQDPKTAKYNSMPLASINDQHVDIIVPASEMGEELKGIYDFILGKTDLPPRQTPKSQLMIILSILKQKHGVDFSEYKQTTVNRRIQRRMVALHINDTSEYIRLIEDNPDELSKLFNDMLIGVTSFFRDPQEFNALEEILHPALTEAMDTEAAFRVWIAACSTGEEAYSLAITLHELGIGNLRDISIFATDIDTESIKIARSGIYPETVVETIPPELIEKYFQRVNDKYQVKKFIREMIIFSIHDVTNDPPFARLDLIQCRNLLIYFNTDLQERVLRTFAFALKNGGTLFLGISETPGQLENAFVQVKKDHRIFRKIFMPDLKKTLPATGKRRLNDLPGNLLQQSASQQLTTDNQLLQHIFKTVANNFLPLSVLINENMSVLYLREENPFLKIPARTSTFNILKMVPAELELDLRTALHDAQKSGSVTQSNFRHIHLKDNSERLVRIVVLPVNDTFQRHSLFVVSFQEEPNEAFPFRKIETHSTEDDRERCKHVETELKETRTHLQTVVEELETSNEELQAANEELQSTNEELQSTNEELETTNEELHSTNEEIQVAYNELKISSEENEKLRSQAIINLDRLEKEQKLLEGISDASLSATFALQAVRDERFEIYDFKCVHFNKMAGEIFGLIPKRHFDKSITELIPAFSQSEPFMQMTRVCNTRNISKQEMTIPVGDEDRHFNRIIVPFLDGIVLSIYDITERVRAQEQAAYFQNRFRLAVEASGIGIWEWNVVDGRLFLDETMHAMFGIPVTQSLTLESWQSLFRDDTSIQSLVNQVISSGESLEAEFELANPESITNVRLRANVFSEKKVPQRIIGTCIDITPYIQARQKSEDARLIAENLNQKKNIFIANTSHELRTPLHAIQSFTHLARKKSNQEEVQHLLDRVEQSSKRLRNIIDDLLEISKLKTGKVSLNFISSNLSEIINNCVANTQILFDEKHQQVLLHIPSELNIEIDERFMSQVIINLLSNANKYAPESSSILISAIQDKQQIDHVILSVKDQGPGISEEDLERVFEPFERSMLAAQQVISGTGLGLAICKDIVELHHGKIWAESPVAGTEYSLSMNILLPMRQQSGQ